MSTPSPTGVLPVPRADFPQIPAQRGPSDRITPRPGRHRAADRPDDGTFEVDAARAPAVRTPAARTPAARTAIGTSRATGRPRAPRTVDPVTLAARVGSVVTLAAVLAIAAAAAGLTDGVPPNGDAAAVATETLRGAP